MCERARVPIQASRSREDDRAGMQGPANHIAFAKLVLVTVTRVEAILLKTAQLAAQRSHLQVPCD